MHILIVGAGAVGQVYARHLVGRTTLMPGVVEALDFLRMQGCAMAVVTNKLVDATETILGHFGLRDYFEVVIGDSTEPPLSLLARKPQPDMLLEALRRFGVTADEAVMVGDSGVDVRAAKAAGIRVVAVGGGYSAEPLESFGPDRLIESFADLPTVFKD